MQRAIDRQCHTCPDRVRLLHSYTGQTGRHKQQHADADADRDLQRLTEADRDSQRNAGICIEMHRLLGRHRERETEADRDRERERDRDKQIQTETDRDRAYIQIYIQVDTDICREGHLDAKSY